VFGNGTLWNRGCRICLKRSVSFKELQNLHIEEAFEWRLNRLHVKLVSVVQLGLRGRSRQGYEPAGKSKTRIIAEEHGKAH
jgi:hypothetical protein